MFDEAFAKLPVEPPRRPESLPGLRLRNVIPNWAIVPPLFFLGFFGGLFWPPIGESLKARRLFKSGRLAEGKVIFVRKRSSFLWPGMPGNSASLVFIELQPAKGVLREVVASCQNEWLLGQLGPGAKVHVAYLGDSPKAVALLDAYYR